MTSIKPCACPHPYQDKRYGAYLRVHNKTKKGDWRCAVCEKEKAGTGKDKEVTKK